jgi:ASC-1-like (ASCH) protein
MDHLAIMRKSWGLTEKILSGEKRIESRWSAARRAPFGRVKAGDNVYFKNTGEPVTVMAEVVAVKEFSSLTKEKVGAILKRYGRDDGIAAAQLSYFYDLFKDRKYCTLIFLKNASRVKPFNVNKAGYGSMASWLCLNKIDDIKIDGKGL